MKPHTSKTAPVASRRTALRRMGLMAAGCCLSLPTLGQDQGAQKIFFYSPETNVNNFSVLKAEFDTLLAPLGGHVFQPFSDRETFERQLEARPRGLFLLSSWHFGQLAGRHDLEPLLVGHSRGTALQRHRIFARTSDPEGLRSRKVATAGTREFALTLLREMLPGQEDLVRTVDLLVVPKDIDALMAVGFGAAHAAIATESGVEKLAGINPKQRDSLGPIGEPRESLLPVLATIRGSGPEARELARILAGVDSLPEGKSRLRLLGLEAMRPLDAEQNARLTR